MSLSENPSKIREILALRACGWTINSLSIHFGKDRTSIRHHLVKYNIQPQTEEIRFKLPKAEPAPRPVSLVPQKYNFDDEPINKGHSYKEYLEMAKERHPEEQHHKLPIGRTRMSDILVDVL